MTPPPLLLAGHGSVDAAGAAAFAAFRARVAAVLAPGSVDVAGGFIELSPPPLSAAVAELAARGHRHVVAVPVVLVAAGHAKGDIPAALASQRARHPGLSFSYGRPLGPHPVLLSLLAERIGAVLGDGGPRRGGQDRPVPATGSHHPQAFVAARARRAGQAGEAGRAGQAGEADRAGQAGQADQAGQAARQDPAPAGWVTGAQPLAVLVVGRGSTDPDANAEMFKTARLLWETAQAGEPRIAFAETAFVSLAAPGVAAGLERCRRLGGRRIVVARCFLFPGVLPDRVAAQARAYAAAHPELDIRCTDVLGDCDELAQLVVARYREALTGDIRMNCDMCVYRTALPGFEYRVGAAQRPHHHPDEPAARGTAHGGDDHAH